MSSLHPSSTASQAVVNTARPREAGSIRGRARFTPYLLATPYTIVLLCFLVLPVALIVTVSFWEYSNFKMTPGFTLDNYRALLTPVYLKTYLNTFKFALITWAFTIIIGYPIAYFLAFEVKSDRTRFALFLLCTVPFLTSNIIRSIAWIPFLGRNGILNSSLMLLGVTDAPIDIFLFSDVSVIISLVHLYTLFMIVPVFNTMMRIEHSLIEAAKDAGASELGVVRDIIFPLSLPGIAIGTIFVVSLVLGNFTTVRLMSGGQASSVGLFIRNMINSLQYPLAAANAVVLLLVTLLVVGTLLSIVDVRKEL